MFVGGAIVTTSLIVSGCGIGENKMFGLVAKITSTPGERDNLISILLEGTANMLGNISYDIAKDNENSDDIWITEVWDNQANQEASLQLESVQTAIGKGRPLIAAMSRVATTTPMAR